jgi:hypothetical protein
MRPRFQPSRPVEQAIGAERRTSEKRELCDAGHRQEADPRAGLAACSPSGGPSRGRTCSHGRASHPRRLAIRRRRSSTPASSLVPSGGGPARLHPTEAQRNEWDGARGRALDVRAALIERHRDVLPDFTGASLAHWDQYYAERRRQEDEIAKDFDVQRRAAMDQFYRGDSRWLATLEAAIGDLGIAEEEVEELRARTQARPAEAEAARRIR